MEVPAANINRISVKLVAQIHAQTITTMMRIRLTILKHAYTPNMYQGAWILGREITTNAPLMTTAAATLTAIELMWRGVRTQQPTITTPAPQ